MTTDSNFHRGLPSDLTSEQRVHYEALANSVDAEQFEAEYREMLAHPESWVTIEDVLREVGMNVVLEGSDAGDT